MEAGAHKWSQKGTQKWIQSRTPFRQAYISSVAMEKNGQKDSAVSHGQNSTGKCWGAPPPPSMNYLAQGGIDPHLLARLTDRACALPNSGHIAGIWVVWVAREGVAVHLLGAPR